MAQTQARMTALVGKALEQTIEEMEGKSIHLDPPNSTAEADELRKVSEIFTRHLCALLYPKQEPEVKP